MRRFGTGLVELGGRNVQHVVTGQDAGAALHGFDVDGEILSVGADEEILTPVLSVGRAERTDRSGQVVAIGKDNFTECAREAHHARLRESVFIFVPDIGNVMVPNGIVDQLAGKKLLLVADGDLNKRAVSQNNLLHANLMASKVSTKPIKMTEKGT
jgi:hypothetical protein